MDKNAGYLGLLRWSLAYNDGTSPEPARAMSAEDRAWLTEAFEHLTVDEAKRMKELLDLLRSEDSEEKLPEKEEALDELEFFVESIDNARDMCTLGGLNVMRQLLGSSFPSLRAAAANVLATMSQNNTKVQDLVFAARLLPGVMHMSVHDPDENARIKALLALSCIVRDHADSTREFLSGEGLSVLGACMGGDSPLKAQRRAVFLLRHLLASDAHAPQTCTALTRPQHHSVLCSLATLARSVDLDVRENAFHAFLAYLSASGAPGAVAASAPASAGSITLHAPATEASDALTAAAPSPSTALVIVDTDTIPPFYERAALCCSEPINLKQVVSARLAALSGLTGDEAAACEGEKEACERLVGLLGQ